MTQLREQLRKPTRKPVTIKVLEAAQNEIKVISYDDDDYDDDYDGDYDDDNNSEI